MYVRRMSHVRHVRVTVNFQNLWEMISFFSNLQLTWRIMVNYNYEDAIEGG